MHRSLSHPYSVRIVLAAVLAVALAVVQMIPARAEGPGTDRLLIAEMGSLKAGISGLPGAIAKQDFEAAQRQLANIDRNWPAVRAELERRGDADAIADFESSLDSAAAAVESGDGEAASAHAATLRSTLDAVRSSLESPDFSSRRIVTALLVPLMLIAALTVSLPAIARKVGVRR